MFFYLSSYKLGNTPQKLGELFTENKKIAYLPNALDSKKISPEWLSKHIESDIGELNSIGLQAELLDLKDFFGERILLQEKLKSFGGVYISGGNVFILRQAMQLSHFDSILTSLPHNFIYAGYSAAGCVLSKSLDAYSIVDNPTDFPYPAIQHTIWKGLNIIPYVFLPHYNSDHSESEDINKELEYCISRSISYKTLQDGEVMIEEREL